MLAVRGTCQDCVVVADVFAYYGTRSVGQHNIVLGEAFLHNYVGRYHDHEAASETEGEDGACFFGELLKGTMHGRLEEVEMPDYRDCRHRTRWKFSFFSTEKENNKGDEENCV